MPWVTDLEALVLVDTVRSDAAPGTIRLYRRDELLKHPPQARLSPHDPGVKEALLTAEFAGRGPREVLLVGAVPADDGHGRAPEPGPARGRPARRRRGAEASSSAWAGPPRRRSAPRSPDIWWERARRTPEPGARDGAA